MNHLELLLLTSIYNFCKDLLLAGQSSVISGHFKLPFFGENRELKIVFYEPNVVHFILPGLLFLFLIYYHLLSC